MDEYISREAVVRYLKGFSEKELNSRGNFGMITSSVLDKAERAISEMPAADVQPVKHGRWMYPFYCSECGFTPYYSSDLTYNYCPNCGCKMDLESDNE